MPVFQVGLSFASALAAALNAPCCLTTHQRGHLAAAGMGQKDLPDPHLAMHLSGGTTELLRVDGEEISVLGRSLDLHMGQLIDRLGVRMGLPFPAGPQVELLAAEASPAGRYKVSVSGTDAIFPALKHRRCGTWMRAVCPISRRQRSCSTPCSAPSGPCSCGPGRDRHPGRAAVRRYRVIFPAEGACWKRGSGNGERIRLRFGLPNYPETMPLALR